MKTKFEDTFIVAAGWMVTVLGLKGNELLAFSLIHGFSQDGETEFKGSISFIMKWLNCSRRTVINVVASLEEKSYIIKRQEEINGVTFNRHSVNFGVVNKMKEDFTRGAKITPPLVQKMHGGGVKSARGGSAKSAPNNILLDKNDNNIVGTDNKETDASLSLFEGDGHLYSVNNGKSVTLKEEKTSGKKEERENQARELIKVLNDFAGRQLPYEEGKRGASTNVGYVVSLLKKKYTFDELELMIQYKCFEWVGTDSEKHLQPITLFKRHGERYVQQAIEAKNNPKFLEAVRRHKEKQENSSQANVLQATEITKGVAEELQNW